MIKAIAIDYNCILSYTPTFFHKMLEIINEELEVDLTEEELRKATLEVENSMLRHITKTGLAIPEGFALNLLLHRLGITDLLIKANVYSKIEQCFIENPPYVHFSKFDLLKQLSEKYVLVLTCNNIYFSKDVILKVLRNLKVLEYFKFYHFSDEHAKPSNKFFYRLFLYLGYNQGIIPEEVLNIGPNHVCDVIGAEKFGFKAMQIDCINDNTINLIKKYFDYE